jgi:hypothetical protein
MPNTGVENAEDDGRPIERGTKQQQRDGTATDNITASSVTGVENQYVEGQSDRASDTGMVTDVQRGSTEDLGINYMEQDTVRKPSYK